MRDLRWLSIGELAQVLGRREISAVEVLESTLRHIEATEPSVHAFVGVMHETALEEAKRADDDLARGIVRGPLHGVPVGVKDLCYTAGFPTSGGSKVLEGFVPSEDATVVRKLREAGALIVGKTVTHEFAYGQDVPPTRNAWDLSCYPGGSSAGSGVSVAVGSAYGAIGSDTGGSIRVPAAVNGIVSLKPTHGRVGRKGVLAMSPTLDTVGPLTRNVRDCALLLSAIAGIAAGDSTVIEEPVQDYVGELDTSLKGVRIGVEREYFFYDAVEPEVRAAVEAAILQLEVLGATLVEVQIEHIEHAVPAGLAVLVGDTSERHQSWLRERPAKYVRETRVMLQLGELLLATAYAKAQKIRTLVQRGLRSAFEDNGLDAIVAPTTPVTTMPVKQLSVDLTRGGETALASFIHHGFPANVTGIPSLSVPVGFTAKSLPIGMQLMGRPFGEGTLFRIGHAYQTATSWQERHPAWIPKS